MMTIEYSLDLKVVLFRHFKKKSLILSCRETFTDCLDNVRALHPVHVWSIWSLIHTFSFFLHSLIPFMYNSYTSMFRLIKLNRVLGAINPTTTYFTGTVAIKHLYMHSHLQELNVTHPNSNNNSACTSQID